MLKKFNLPRIYWMLGLCLFPVMTMGQAMNKNPVHLNLGFEQLDKDGTPVGVKWQEDVGKYDVSIDSLDKVEGKYSLKLQSERVPGGGRMSFVDVLYHLKGDYLAKKEVMVTAYLKLKDVSPAFTGLWYNKYPWKNNHVKLLFYGGMALKGTSDWRKYKLIFYTDSITKSISFGAYLFGKGTVNVDHFSVYLDDIPIDSIVK